MKVVWIGGGLAALGFIVGWYALPTAPPVFNPMLLVPGLLAGIGLVIQSTAGRGLGFLGKLVPENSWVHVPLVLLGWSLIAGSALGISKLPPAGASDVYALSAELESFCQNPNEVRAERTLLPVLVALDRALQRQDEGPIKARGLRALQSKLPDCAERVREAFLDPEGTHTSWKKLRSWMQAHPDYASLDPSLFTLPFHPRKHHALRRPVQIDL